jgi:hypothetical protein
VKLENETRDEYKRRWQRENKDKVKIARDRYLKKNREIIAQRSQEWRKNNPEKLKELKPHWHRKTSYGITRDEYEEKFKQQEGCCAICSHQHQAGRRTGLVVDHDHKTGKFRGLLCHSCNRGIGLLKEDVKILNSAIKYLS